MKKLTLLILCCVLLSAYNSGAQTDTTTFTFTTTDSLRHFLDGIISPDSIAIDTTTSHLWQIGNTQKPIFSNGTILSRGIMTDTLNAYPANANDWFVLKLFRAFPNPQIDIWHEYQMDSAHAGGTIEFSTDLGSTWLNIDSCGNIILLISNFRL